MRLGIRYVLAHTSLHNFSHHTYFRNLRDLYAGSLRSTFDTFAFDAGSPQARSYSTASTETPLASLAAAKSPCNRTYSAGLLRSLARHLRVPYGSAACCGNPLGGRAPWCWLFCLIVAGEEHTAFTTLFKRSDKNLLNAR